MLGMMAAHSWPREGGAGELLVDGRPSVLFAFVAGAALGLVTGGESPPLERRGEARMRLLIRAALLLALGLLLWMLPSGIAIVLDYLGVMFLIMIPLLFASRAVLVVVGAIVLLIGPVLRDLAVAPTLLDGGLLADEPWSTVAGYLLTGYYPALLWIPVLTSGLLCARAGLGSRRVQALMVGIGALASLVGYGLAAVLPGVDASAHSGTTAELLGAGGLAAALTGAALLALDGAQRQRIPLLLAAPLTALGRMPLTVYTAHVVVIAALAPFGPAGRFDAELGVALFLALSLGGIAIALAWQALGWRGPVEWLFTTIAGLPYRRHADGARLGA